MENQNQKKKIGDQKMKNELGFTLDEAPEEFFEISSLIAIRIRMERIKREVDFVLSMNNSTNLVPHLEIIKEDLCTVINNLP